MPVHQYLLLHEPMPAYVFSLDHIGFVCASCNCLGSVVMQWCRTLHKPRPDLQTALVWPTRPASAESALTESMHLQGLKSDSASYGLLGVRSYMDDDRMLSPRRCPLQVVNSREICIRTTLKSREWTEDAFAKVHAVLFFLSFKSHSHSRPCVMERLCTIITYQDHARIMIGTLYHQTIL